MSLPSFDNIRFKGTFRTYQKEILDECEKYLTDKKLNVVAAPGSGKTILGLEIIRKLHNRALILSPTTTIKHQWGERLKELFLPDDVNPSDYLSYDLHEIKLINSITYQALYSMMEKVKVEDEEIDFSSLDILQIIKEFDIKTICLDEAHHLKNKWQKSLSIFLKSLDKDITIISLTATPPYDASPEEWKRYQETCGDIDAEIFIPELVKEKTLCPHQDYIYFNYATIQEQNIFQNYRLHALTAISEINDLACIKELNDRINQLYKEDKHIIFAKSEAYYYLELYIEKYFSKYNRHLVHLFAYGNKKKLTLQIIEEIYSFLLKSAQLLNSAEKHNIEQILRKHGFERYEISNFSKPGFESKHNLTYWKDDEYIGIGCGASGYYYPRRYKMSSSLTDYIRGKRNYEAEIVHKKDNIDYFLICNLRLKNGFSPVEFKSRFGFNFEEKYKNIIKQYISSGFLVVNKYRIYCSDEGLIKLDLLLRDLV